MEIHHIVPESKGGEDTEENGIPLCFDCHAEVESYNPQHPKGRKFTSSELRKHKEQWFTICSNPDWHTKRQPVLPDDDYLNVANLSSEARTLLIEASQDLYGIIIYTRTFDGTHFETNEKQLCQDQSARSVAKWKNSLDILIFYGLLEESDYNGEIFTLTDHGFEVADLLSGNTIPK